MEVKINKFDYFGRGIAKNNEKIVFVNRALPNELLDIEIIKENKKYDDDKIIKVNRSSDDRIKAICPYYNKCGGCTFLHTTYDNEKQFKINKAKELLGKCDSFYETDKLNYRNKVVLHVKNGKIGLYEEGSNILVNIDYCYLLNDNINKVIQHLNKKNIDGIEKIVIKTHQNKIMLAILGEIDSSFIDDLLYIDTIILNDKVIKGNGFLEEVIDNRIFKITSNAFFQVNKTGLLNIYKVINKFLENKKINKVLDLYSGISLWSILISDKVSELYSVEINKEACLNAKENLKRNNISNIKIINGDVKDYIDTFTNIDLVIIDPPRSGLDKKTRKYLKIINSKYIIYISCDMISLKRDLEELKEKYDVQEIDLIDMFKRTYHSEVITILEKK